MSGSDALTDAVFKIYQDTGTQVTYVTARGERKPYWANRLRQAIERASQEDDVEGLVERVVTGVQSRGFDYLANADRLDLSVEALVAERFRDRFSDEVVRAAESRLRDHGYEPKPTDEADEPDEGEASHHPKAPQEVLAGEFNLHVSVAEDGTLSARLVP